jgi:hypothetical protein
MIHTILIALVIGLLSIEAVAVVSQIGRPRKPITHAAAVATVVINGLCIAALAMWGF